MSSHLVVDERARCVRLDHQEIDLSAQDFDLLLYMAHHADRVISIDELLREVWRYKEGRPEMVRSCIHRVRKKIEPNHQGRSFSWLKTVNKYGYRLSSERLSLISTKED